jgi:DNA-binding NarL/FixJ family response regulator
VEALPPARPRARLLESFDNPQLTSTTGGCHNGGMTQDTTDHQQAFDRLRQVRAEALEHTRQAQRLARERRDMIRQLIDDGFSQADIARELGVTRQAIQKMLAC